MNNGLNGSSAVRLEIHAPLIPRLTNTSGPKQQADAAIAANAPPTRVVFVTLSWSIRIPFNADRITIDPVP